VEEKTPGGRFLSAPLVLERRGPSFYEGTPRRSSYRRRGLPPLFPPGEFFTNLPPFFGGDFSPNWGYKFFVGKISPPKIQIRLFHPPKGSGPLPHISGIAALISKPPFYRAFFLAQIR